MSKPELCTCNLSLGKLGFVARLWNVLARQSELQIRQDRLALYLYGSWCDN